MSVRVFARRFGKVAASNGPRLQRSYASAATAASSLPADFKNEIDVSRATSLYANG